MNRIDSLIGKYLSGNLNVSEQDELFSWVEASEKNKEYYSEHTNVWNAMNSSRKEVDLDNEFHLLEQKMRKTDKLSNGTFNYNSNHFISFCRKFAAVLIIPILLGGLYLYSMQNDNILKESEAEKMTMYTAKGVRTDVVLPDGTKVFLNSGSKLTYPSRFDKGSRKVALKGEAFFQVAHNKEKPFIISINSLKVKVLGTSFNLNAYDRKSIETTLFEGSVELFSKKQEPEAIRLKPGFKANYNSDTEIISVEKANLRQACAWRDGTIIFLNTPMSEVESVLERWFDVNITISDPRFYNYSFTATFENRNLIETLSLLKSTSPFEYTVDGHEVTIYTN